MTSKPLFAAARVQKLASMASIRAAEAHGRRTDETAAKRVDPARTPLNLAASQYSPDDPLALEAAFRAFKAKTGAVEGKGAAIMAHVIAVISPEALRDAGDPRDPQNPKVQALFREAQAWARAEFGEESLIAARLDVDEAGAGVVDLYLSPTAMQSGGRGRKEKLTISVKTALEGIAKREQVRQGLEKPPRSYSALQDAWSLWAAEKIDRRLQRGKPKREAMREHVHADLFRERVQELNAREADLAAQQKSLSERFERFCSRELDVTVALKAREAAVKEREAKVDIEVREARKETFQAINGLVSSWAEGESGLSDKGKWKALRGITKERLGVLKGWVQAAGQTAASIVSKFETVLGELKQDIEMRRDLAQRVTFDEDDEDDLGYNGPSWP